MNAQRLFFDDVTEFQTIGYRCGVCARIVTERQAEGVTDEPHFTAQQMAELCCRWDLVEDELDYDERMHEIEEILGER